MKRFTQLLRSKSHDARTSPSSDDSPRASSLPSALPAYPPDTPEHTAVSAISAFCTSPSPSHPPHTSRRNQSGQQQGEGYLHLPAIVEAAESSPSAAEACCHAIAYYLSPKGSGKKAAVQYNAIMLIRILTDNPGETFTRNWDESLVGVVRGLVRECRDPGVQTILRDTLEWVERERGWDQGTRAMVYMWRHEKETAAGAIGQLPRQGGVGGGNGAYVDVYSSGNGAFNAGGASGPYGNQRPRGSRRSAALPPPQELASRVEEARNTAKILLQLVQSTPPEEVLGNELVKEFGERCQSAQKSMQGYIGCEDPSPDDDTLQTLIETTEQLSLAGSRYQRAILAARRSMQQRPGMDGRANSYMSGGAASVYSQQGNGERRESLFASPSPPPVQNGVTSLFAAPPQQSQANGLGLSNYSPPMGPPPGQQYGRQSQQPSPPSSYHPSPALGYQQPAYNQQSATPGSNSYNASPAMQHAQPAGTYEDQHRSGPRTVPFSADPFQDPVASDQDYPAPLRMSPRSPPLPLQHQQPAPPRRESSAFSIESQPSYAPQHPTTTSHNEDDEDEAYAASPITARHPDHRDTFTAPPPAHPSVVTSSDSSQGGLSSQQRPGPGPWHNDAITPSYLGRQESAAEGLTMHGASPPTPVEIDSTGQVGRYWSERKRDAEGRT